MAMTISFIIYLLLCSFDLRCLALRICQYNMETAMYDGILCYVCTELDSCTRSKSGSQGAIWVRGWAVFPVIICLCWMMWSMIISLCWNQREPKNIKQNRTALSVIRSAFDPSLRTKMWSNENICVFGSLSLTWVCFLDGLTHTA